MRALPLVLLLSACATPTPTAPHDARRPEPVVLRAPDPTPCRLLAPLQTVAGVASPDGAWGFEDASGNLESLEFATGKVRWQVAGLAAPVLASDRGLFALSGGAVVLYDLATGQRRLTSPPLPVSAPNFRVATVCLSEHKAWLSWQGLYPGEGLACCGGGEPARAVQGVLELDLDTGQLERVTQLPERLPAPSPPQGATTQDGQYGFQSRPTGQPEPTWGLELTETATQKVYAAPVEALYGPMLVSGGLLIYTPDIRTCFKRAAYELVGFSLADQKPVWRHTIPCDPSHLRDREELPQPRPNAARP